MPRYSVRLTFSTAAGTARRSCALLALVVLLIGGVSCNAERPAEESAAAAASTLPSEREFVAACQSASNMGESLCTCVAQKAKADLSETGYAFLVASLREDTARADELRDALTVQEATAAGMFMTRAPRECAAEGS